jgi:hypothetical protein
VSKSQWTAGRWAPERVEGIAQNPEHQPQRAVHISGGEQMDREWSK